VPPAFAALAGAAADGAAPAAGGADVAELDPRG
jgi:hypothetical protein